MGLRSRLRQLARRAATVPSVHLVRRRDETREAELRAQLAADPNNRAAFGELAGLLAARAARSPADADPLIAEAPDGPRRAADLAVWALAEEFAGNPRGWYPLVEMGRLSLADDHDGAMRRFATAADRDQSGRALAESVKVLRDAGMPVAALGLGTGHWRSREHDPRAGFQLVGAAIDAGRVGEARNLLDAMNRRADASEFEPILADFSRQIDAAQRATKGRG